MMPITARMLISGAKAVTPSGNRGMAKRSMP